MNTPPFNQHPQSIFGQQWWKPFYLMQRDLNVMAQGALDIIPSQLLWHSDAAFLDSARQTMQRLFSEGFNANQYCQAGPAIDIIENDVAFTINAELPGIKGDDIDLSTQDGAIIIKGTKKEQKNTIEETHIRQECTYGTFERVIALPEAVDIDDAEAIFQHNILTIQVPKLAKTQESATPIPIQDKNTSKVETVPMKQQKKQVA